MSRVALQVTPTKFVSTKTYEVGIEAAGGVFLSGLTGTRVDPETGAVQIEGGLVDQAVVLLDKIEASLAPTGRALTDVTSIMQYLPPAALPDLPKLLDYYTERFQGNPPLVNTIAVSRLLRRAAMIEAEGGLAKSLNSGIVRFPISGGKTTAEALDNAAKLLEAQGLNWSDVRKSTLFVKVGTPVDAAAIDKVGIHPLQITMPVVAQAENNVELQMIACRDANDAVVFASAEGDPSVGGIAEQCEDIYRRIDEKLKASGASLGSVVKTTEFVTATGLPEYRLTADVRRRTFSAPYPAASGLICEGLAKPGSLIVVEVVAVKEGA